MLPKCLMISVPARARTVDPLIKSQLLYQLSYRDIWDRKCMFFPEKNRGKKGNIIVGLQGN
jgi:hypothetical protein